MNDRASSANRLRLRRLGIETRHEPVLYMRHDCPICRSEGFSAHARVEVRNGERSIIATLNQITTDLLHHGEASLSEIAWALLNAREGSEVSVAHAPPVDSLGHVRAKLYGNSLTEDEILAVVGDVVAGRYSDIQLAAFVSACSGVNLSDEEILSLTRAMVRTGERLHWGSHPVVDKHCVGGLPGNRTTPILVPIVAACGLTMPKTSSRAITSPAGTADVMETLTCIDLDLAGMRRVVEREGGCIVWGGAVRLAPADDIFIRVERALDVDSTGQLVASVISKKVAAGSTHLVLDLPVGPTAKVRGPQAADELYTLLVYTARAFGLETRVIRSAGEAPVGRGIGPALEARDVIDVLRGSPEASAELRDRALALAGALLELGGAAPDGAGLALAARTLEDGSAWRKFQAICEAQGGMRIPPVASHSHVVAAPYPGRVTAIDNRKIARVAKLAGAPDDAAAGLDLLAPVGTQLERGSPLFAIHAMSPGGLDYALRYVRQTEDIIRIEDGL
jgi:thymidine phosphorylase